MAYFHSPVIIYADLSIVQILANFYIKFNIQIQKTLLYILQPLGQFLHIGLIVVTRYQLDFLYRRLL